MFYLYLNPREILAGFYSVEKQETEDRSADEMYAIKPDKWS